MPCHVQHVQGDLANFRLARFDVRTQQHRSLEKNRAEALARLHALVSAAATIPRQRRPTRPTAASRKRRIESKIRRGQVKALRGRVTE